MIKRKVKQRCKEKKKKDKIQELKTQYQYYVDLVDSQVEKKLDLTVIELEKDDSFEYLISFSDNVNWVCENKITGKPDSFIMASCLMYSILSNPIIKINNLNSKYAELIELALNLDMALKCVYEIISEPVTYFLEEDVWIEKKNPKVKITIPKGLIENDDLQQRIRDTIYSDELSGNRTSIMQFANMLHLIYLSCQNCQ